MTPLTFSLKDRTALVVGGCGVLGSAIATALAEAGATVIVTSRDKAKASAHAGKLARPGRGLFGEGMEPSDPQSVADGLDRIETSHGPVSILVNAAGGNRKEATVSPGAPFFDLSAEALRGVLDTNLFAGTIIPSQVVGKRMAAGGTACSIINIASVSALRPLTNVGGYGAAKAAVCNLTQWLAVYFARDLRVPVRVNAIVPGFFLTEQNRFLLTREEGGLTPRGDSIIAHTPMGRFGEPDELGGAAVWLASDASRFVTGAIIPVDGGFTAFSGV